MYTVVIVEDEVLISVGLRNMIRWHDMDMVIVGEAQNGKQGLQLYHQKKPDLILTDIKMPVMDGLEMIREIRQRDAVTKIIVLTCYEDFELVREAFKLGISDYILKLKMLPEDMENIVRKVRQELGQEGRRREGGAQEQEREKELGAKCREYVICPNGGMEEEPNLSREVGEYLGIGENGLTVCVMETCLCERKQGVGKQQEERVGQVIVNLVQEILDEKHIGRILWENEKRFVCVLGFPGREGEREAALKALIFRITSVVQTYTNRHAVVGCSSFCDSYHGLHRLYLEGRKAEELAVFLGEDFLFYDMDGARELYERQFAEFERQTGQMDWLTEGCRQKILTEISLRKMSWEPERDVIREEFCRWLHSASLDNVLRKEGTLKIVLDAAGRIRRAASLGEMTEIFREYSLAMSAAEDSAMVSPEVAKTIAYIGEHYSRADISLSRAAFEVGMNKEYLSSRLKKETGMGFSEHVNRLRIEKAKELLRTTNMKSYEITQEVGFQDESYFSRVFKKRVGMRPNEYKKQKLEAKHLPGGGDG